MIAHKLKVPLLTAVIAVGLASCAGGRVGVGYRTGGWYGHYGPSPWYRCCSRSVIVLPPGEIAPPDGGAEQLPIEPAISEPIATPFPADDFGGFGDDFGGGDMDFGDF